MGRLKSLSTLRNGKKLIEVAESFNKQKEDFTPNQLSYLEAIYEKSWESKGFESATTKHDFKKRF